jgi:hypothetical protein
MEGKAKITEKRNAGIGVKENKTEKRKGKYREEILEEARRLGESL